MPKRSLLVCLLFPTFLQAQPSLDLIPHDAVFALVVRNFTELQKKGDKLAEDTNLSPRMRPSTIFPLAYAVLGIRQGSVDESRPIAIVAVNPKVVSKDNDENNLNAKCIAAALPLKDLEGLARFHGVKEKDLKDGKIVTLERKGGFLDEAPMLFVKDDYLYFGFHEKAIRHLAASKGISRDLTAVQKKMFGESDIVLHLGTQAWGEVWTRFLRDVDANLDLATDPEEKKTAKDVVEALGKVRFGLAGLRVGDGLGLSFASILPKEDAEAAKKFLLAFRGGDGASSLKGLPEGNVVAAQAARGDGAQNGRLARVFFRAVVQKLLEPEKFFGAADRSSLLAVFSEVWTRLQGSRMALYRTADAKELGQFSVVGILDVEDPDKFLTELKQLARLGSGDGIDLKTETGRKLNEAAIEQLIKDLGHRRFNVRDSAAAKLELAGDPVLPYLEKALESPDLETKRRAADIKREILKAAEARKKELLSGELTKSIKPSFEFLEKSEKIVNVEVRLIAVKLSRRDAATVPQLAALLGPEWNRIRMAVLGKQVVVLVGSDTGLLKAAIENVKKDRPGLASAKVLQEQGKKTDPGRKIELHVSTLAAAAMVAPADKPIKLPAVLPLSSLSLSVEADRLQMDVWMPTEELKGIIKAMGW